MESFNLQCCSEMASVAPKSRKCSMSARSWIGHVPLIGKLTDIQWRAEVCPIWSSHGDRQKWQWRQSRLFWTRDSSLPRELTIAFLRGYLNVCRGIEWLFASSSNNLMRHNKIDFTAILQSAIRMRKCLSYWFKLKQIRGRSIWFMITVDLWLLVHSFSFAFISLPFNFLIFVGNARDGWTWIGHQISITVPLKLFIICSANALDITQKSESDWETIIRSMRWAGHRRIVVV